MGPCRDHSCPNYTSCVPLSSWSSVCVVTACGPTIEHANRGYHNSDDNSDTMTSVGVKRYLYCDTGYIGYRSVTCLANGNWSEPGDHCRDCAIVSPMQNAVTTATAAPAGSTITYTCNTGYTHVSGTGNRFCNSQGFWETLDITCSPVDCGDPGWPPGVNGMSYGSLSYQGVVSYSCSSSYTSTNPGSMQVTCQSDGNWSPRQFDCM
ncbi:E-selectin-like [Argopecten irradians]|uniref:E-selectin-like n=1 Tax=Argopecten irradians TaxID=31199 RepID=UPI003717BC00